jgi:hypothetical protein
MTISFPGVSLCPANWLPITTAEDPAANPLTMSPEFFVPPSQSIVLPKRLAALAASRTAVI